MVAVVPNVSSEVQKSAGQVKGVWTCHGVLEGAVGGWGWGWGLGVGGWGLGVGGWGLGEGLGDCCGGGAGGSGGLWVLWGVMGPGRHKKPWFRTKDLPKGRDRVSAERVPTSRTQRVAQCTVTGRHLCGSFDSLRVIRQPKEAAMFIYISLVQHRFHCFRSAQMT